MGPEVMNFKASGRVFMSLYKAFYYFTDNISLAT